ncbi:MAG TPA: hypothetical protein VF230_07325 [Acidimicrobiales bacterium]
MATITLEDDAPPIVRIVGVTLRRAAADPSLAATIDQMQGTIALRSTKDPQAATITFRRGDVFVRHGVAPDADIVISADLETMGRPGAPKPKVKGAVPHPKLALAVAKVLDPPVKDGWRGAVREMWEWAGARPPHVAWRPAALRVVCTDGGPDGGELVFGDPAADLAKGRFEVHGPAWALTAVFTGGDHLGAALVEGRIRGIGDFPTMNRMVGLLSCLMLGDD